MAGQDQAGHGTMEASYSGKGAGINGPGRTDRQELLSREGREEIDPTGRGSEDHGEADFIRESIQNDEAYRRLQMEGRGDVIYRFHPAGKSDVSETDKRKGRETGPFLWTKIFLLHATMAERRRDNDADLY